MKNSINTKELALISVFSATWIVAQVQFGKYIGSITHVHGIVNRLVGWLLMFLTGSLTRKFGRITIMSGISALATRVARTPRNPFEASIVGSGYFLGGLGFDILFSLYKWGGSEDKKSLLRTLSYCAIGLISGLIASLPWQIYKLSFLGIYGYIAYFISLGGLSAAKQVILSIVGTFMGLSIGTQVKFARVR